MRRKYAPSGSPADLSRGVLTLKLLSQWCLGDFTAQNLSIKAAADQGRGKVSSLDITQCKVCGVFILLGCHTCASSLGGQGAHVHVTRIE